MNDNQLKIVINGLRKREVRYLPYMRQTVEDVCIAFPFLNKGYDITVNGKLIPSLDRILTPLQREDKIVCVPNFGEPFSIAAAITGVAAGISSVAGFGTFILGIGISVAMSIGIGYLITALSGKPKRAEERSTSQTYSWNPKTTQRQGDVKPLIFGTHKSSGNIVGAYVQVVDSKLRMNALIAHGTGPVEAITDHRINNRPSASFPDLSVETRRGLLDQTPISFFEKMRVAYHPNIPVTNSGGALTWPVPNNNYDDLELIINATDFYYHKSGGRENFGFQVKIEITETGEDDWTTVYNANVTGSGTNSFYKSFKMSDLAFTIDNGTFYTVRITKISADSTSDRVTNDLLFEFVTEISDDAFEYPGMVLVGYSGLLQEEFQGLQQSSCVIQGQILEVYDSEGEEWVLEYSDNPAYVAGFALSKPVISGDGDGTPYAMESYEGLAIARIDWAALYALAVHSNTLVPDGKGGIEKLITFNGIFDTNINMWEAVGDICKISRANPVWLGNKAAFVIDRSGSRVDIISAGNIVPGSFEEVVLPLKDRVADIDVSYNDVNSNYERTLLRTFSSSLSTHVNKITLDLRGVVKKTEAWRLAKYYAAYNELIKRQISVKLDIDAIGYRVGDIIGVQHDRPNWGELEDGYSGSGSILRRIPDAGGDTLELDYDIEDALTDGVTYQILVRCKDNTKVIKTIASVDGNLVTIVGTYGNTYKPDEKDLWVIGKSSFVVKDFRVTRIRRSDNQEFLLSLLEYKDELYDYDDESPDVPFISSTASAKSDKLIRPPSLKDLQTRTPQIALDGPDDEIPTPSNLTFNDDTPGAGSISWSKTDESDDITIMYRGTSYSITPDSTADEFIYWDPEYNTVFRTTNTAAIAMAPGNWMVQINESGEALPAFGQWIIDTRVVKDNAISDDGYAYNEGKLGLVYGTFYSIVWVIYESTGRTIRIQCSSIFQSLVADNTVPIQITRTGGAGGPVFFIQGSENLTLAQDQVINAAFDVIDSDLVEGVTYTYYMKARKGLNVGTIDAMNRTMSITELKK